MSEAAPEPGSPASLTETLWPDPPRTKRGPKPRLTRDEIVAAAAATADTDGIDAVTMQRVADTLGTAKMSLYRYVPGKAELVALALDHTLGDPPALRSDSWRDRLREWAIALHGRMRAHPWSLDVTAGTRVPGPHELAWFEEGSVRCGRHHWTAHNASTSSPCSPSTYGEARSRDQAAHAPRRNSPSFSDPCSPPTATGFPRQRRRSRIPPAERGATTHSRSVSTGSSTVSPH